MGLGKHETIDYVKSRLGLDNFSEGSYKKFRSEMLNDHGDENQMSNGYHIMQDKVS